MKFKLIILTLCSIFTFNAYAAKSSISNVPKENLKYRIENINRGSENDSPVHSFVKTQKHGCFLKRENKSECKVSLWVKLFISALGILAASGVATILEFSIIQWTTMFAAIGWLLFGFGMVMAVLVLILGITRII